MSSNPTYIDFLGNKYWLLNEHTIFHNLKGPAYIDNEFGKLPEYYINNKRYDNFIEYIREVINYECKR